jgi:hypothetical protein
MITNNGLKIAINRINKSTPDYTPISNLKLGSLQTSADIDSTNLNLPIPINSNIIENCDDTTGWTASSGGSLTVNETTYKNNKALNLVKNSYTTISYYKTLGTQYDFTNKYLYGWIYIKNQDILDKIKNIQVIFGNDSANNYYKNISLTTGWNIISMNYDHANINPTPDPTICDFLKIELITFGSDSEYDISAGDIIIDDFVLATESNLTKSMDTGYPSIDEEKLEVSYQFTIDTTEANGFGITGLGTFNTDTTPLMQDIFKFPVISKNSSDEIIFTIKNRLVRR